MRINGLNGSEETDTRTGEAITALTSEMDAIKRLLVLLLTKCGSSQGEIARALGVNQSTISRQFKIGDVEPILTRTEDDNEEE